MARLRWLNALAERRALAWGIEAKTLPPAGFDDLSVDEQIDYVQRLWDRVSAHPEQVPVPAWQRAVLDDRLEAHRKAPSAVWKERR